jgi:hypothetical protein
MPERPSDSFNSTLCPACGKPMACVSMIWRGLQDNLEVLEYSACGVSITQGVKPTPNHRAMK